MQQLGLQSIAPGSPTGSPSRRDPRPQNGAALPAEHPPPAAAAAQAEGGTNGGLTSSLRSMSDTRKAKFKKLLDQQVSVLHCTSSKTPYRAT